MSGATPTAERREEIAGELAEWLHAAAREAQRKLLAAETTEDFASHTNSLCKLARGVRQCLAMHAKFETARLTGAAQVAAEAAEAHAEAVEERRDAISRKVTRRFNETWPDDDDEDENEVFNERLEVLNERLDDLAEADDFLDQDPDALIARLCEEFGVEPPSLTPLIPAKAGTQADSRSAPTPAPLAHRANGHAPPLPDSS